MLAVHNQINQGLGEVAYRCSWMEKGYCHMVRATAERCPVRNSWSFHGGSFCRWKFNGTSGGSEGIPFCASTVDIVLILLEGSSVCSLAVNLHVGLLETKRMAISLLCLTSRFSWLIILKLASLPDCTLSPLAGSKSQTPLTCARTCLMAGPRGCRPDITAASFDTSSAQGLYTEFDLLK